MDRTNIPLVGIVGGIASGKSLVAEQLAAHGAVVVSADRSAHEVLKLEDVKREVRKRWGDAVFSSDGSVDRAAVARIVFAPPPEGPQERKFLEQLTHPKIGQMTRDEVARLQQENTAAAIVLDVPLMLESGWNRHCDRLVFVDAPREQRLARAKARGWTEQNFDGREAVQESLARKRELADVVIDNSGSVESTQAQIEQFWHALVKRPVAR